MTKWQWRWHKFSRQLWVQSTLIGLLGIAAAVIGILAKTFISWELPLEISVSDVEMLLTIIASSMLAVTTFSLSIMTSAYGAATSNVTPRATKLLMEDKLTQNVLSTFIGSFLFSMVGIVVLKTGAYGPQGRIILFLLTILVIALVVVSLLRWINHLLSLGRVGETTNRVELAARQAIVERLDFPYLGGRLFDEQAESNLMNCNNTVYSELIGYVQHIDMQALSACAKAMDQDIYVQVLPGTFVYKDTPMASFAGMPSAADAEKREKYKAHVFDAITVGKERSFEQDPRFGLMVLSEVGTRALSSAINDPGTIIDVIGRCTRLLTLWAVRSVQSEEVEPVFPRIYIKPLFDKDLLDDAFRQFGRDGAALLEVQLRLQKSLLALSRIGNEEFRAAARMQSILAFKRAEKALGLEEEVQMLRAVVEDIVAPDSDDQAEINR